jgi:hypothetical protein
LAALILELQRNALNIEVKVSELLWKTLAVATKLGLSDMVEWAQKELNGYKCNQECPDYRRLRGNIVAQNSVSREWCPVVEGCPSGTEKNADESILQKIQQRPVLQSLPSIESLLADSSNKTFRAELNEYAQAHFRQQDPTFISFSIELAPSQFEGILATIRTMILQWALQLEKDGVLGEDMSFSDKERETVDRSSIVYNNINNFGTATIQQGTKDSTQSIGNIDTASLLSLVQALREDISSFNMANQTEAELEAELQTIEAQAKSPSPKRSILRESLSSVRRLVEAVAAKVLTDHLPQIDEIMRTLGSG